MQNNLSEVLDFINEAQVGKASKSIIITGKQGSGKSNLALQIAMATERDYVFADAGETIGFNPNDVIIVDGAYFTHEMKAILYHESANIIMTTTTLPISYYNDERVTIVRM